MDSTNSNPNKPISNLTEAPNSTHPASLPPLNPENKVEAQNSESDENLPPICRFFSRGFCRDFVSCRFRHEASSVVAEGRQTDNRVCRFHQKGCCRYGGSCRFRHIQQEPLVTSEGGGGGEAEGGGEKEEHSDVSSSLSEGELRDLFMWLNEEELESDMEQRMRNGGFNDDEVFELACQGVKPWDEDAEMVLAALQDIYFDHYFGFQYGYDDDDDWGSDEDDFFPNFGELDLDTSDDDD